MKFRPGMLVKCPTKALLYTEQPTVPSQYWTADPDDVLLILRVDVAPIEEDLGRWETGSIVATVLWRSRIHKMPLSNKSGWTRRDLEVL